jgi:hypothetical protein
MAIFKDLTGQTFGLLTVLQRVENNSSGTAQWLYQCVVAMMYDVTPSSISSIIANRNWVR